MNHRLDETIKDKKEAELFAQAVVLAANAHKYQVRKDNLEPYIMHPMRVAMHCDTMTERIVAVLHDTVEDTWVEGAVILDMFGEVVFEAVYAMTRQDNETYGEFIERCIKNPIAKKVKEQDVLDNLSTLPNLFDRQEAAGLTERYLKSLQMIREGYTWKLASTWYDDKDKLSLRNLLKALAREV